MNPKQQLEAQMANLLYDIGELERQVIAGDNAKVKLLTCREQLEKIAGEYYKSSPAYQEEKSKKRKEY